MSDDDIIGAARRIASYCRSVLVAHDGSEPAVPPEVGLQDCEYHEAVLRIHQMTIPDRYLRDIGSAFGDVADLMTDRARRDPDLAHPHWWELRDHLAAWHRCWGPYEYVVADNVRLGLLEAPPPAPPHFDLLAELVGRETMEGLARSSDWVVDRLAP